MERPTCCFCFDLKHGTLAVGVFSVTIRTVLLVALAILLGIAHRDNATYVETLDVIYGAGICECALSVLFGSLLIIGVCKNIRGLFIPWLVLTIIEIGGSVYFFFGSLFYIHGVLSILQTFGHLLGSLFLTYMSWCVISYYRSLSALNVPYQNFTKESNKVDIPSVPANLGNNTGTII